MFLKATLAGLDRTEKTNRTDLFCPVQFGVCNISIGFTVSVSVDAQSEPNQLNITYILQKPLKKPSWLLLSHAFIKPNHRSDPFFVNSLLLLVCLHQGPLQKLLKLFSLRCDHINNNYLSYAFPFSNHENLDPSPVNNQQIPYC